MKRGLSLVAFSFLMLFVIVGFASFVSADITHIHVKTVPKYEVQVTPYIDTGAFEALERFKVDSDDYGDVDIDFNSNADVFNVVVFVKNDGVTLFEERLLEQKNGEPIDLELIPKWFKPIQTPEAISDSNGSKSSSNVTEDNLLDITENVTNNVSKVKENSALTGLAIIGNGGFLDRYKYYLVGIIVLLLIIIALIYFRKHRSSSKEKIDNNPKPAMVMTKNSKTLTGPVTDSSIVDREDRPGSNLQKIRDAEKKIMEAQEELNKLKGEEKMKFAEQKLKRDQVVLEKLRKASESGN